MQKCSMNFGHTSSLTALWAKLVLLTIEMVRFSVCKAERKEEIAMFFPINPAYEKNISLHEKMEGRHIARKESIGLLPERNSYFLTLLFY